jgi:hypothetical protein
MNRFALALACLLLSMPLVGCGDGGTATRTAGDANLPDEVKQYEARRAEERAKGVTPKAAPKTSKPAAAAGEPGAR